ncbi:MAG: hypothetical protein AB1401_04710 [Thermodesulfobacteriota bacterium]
MDGGQLDEIKRYFDIVAENLRDEIKVIAEGVINLDGKFEREIAEFRKENKEAHSDIMAAIKFSYTDLDRRIAFLENRYESVEKRLKRLEDSC